MTGDSTLLLTLALVLVLSKSAAHATERLGLTAVFGKLMIGLMVGPAVLGWIRPDASLEGFASIGVVLLMFLAGLETDVEGLSSQGRTAFVAAAGGVILPLAAGYFVGILFGLGAIESLFVGTILTATSVSVSAQALKELGKLGSREGSVILGAALIDDVLGVIVLSLVIALGTGDAPLIPMLRMAGFLVVAGGLGWFVVPRAFDRIDGHVSHDTKAALGIGAALAFAWAAEEFGGLAAITGAYLAGVTVSRSFAGEHVALRAGHLAEAFFTPIFFVSVGLQLNGQDLLAAPLFAGVLVAAAIVTKLIGCWAGTFVTTRDTAVSTRVGVGMIARGEVALVVAVTGASAGIVSGEVLSASIVVALATTLIAPLLLRATYSSRFHRPSHPAFPRPSISVPVSGAPAFEEA